MKWFLPSRDNLHIAGYGEVSLLNAKVQDTRDPISDNLKVLRFLGMVGYYWKFCRNFSEVSSLPTDLLKEKKKKKVYLDFEMSGSPW